MSSIGALARASKIWSGRLSSSLARWIGVVQTKMSFYLSPPSLSVARNKKKYKTKALHSVFIRCMDTLNPENEKYSTSLFWENEILLFLPYKARLGTRGILLKEVPLILMESKCYQYFPLLHRGFKKKNVFSFEITLLSEIQRAEILFFLQNQGFHLFSLSWPNEETYFKTNCIFFLKPTMVKVKILVTLGFYQNPGYFL